MAFKLLDRAQMSVTGAPGTGTITLGASTTGYQSFTQAGIADSDSFSYCVVDGTSWEYGVATYASAGSNLTRVVGKTSAQNTNPLNLSSKAVITACLRAEDVALSATLAGLSDVNVTEGAAIDGYRLTWDNTSGRWIAQLVSGSALAINNTGILVDASAVSLNFINATSITTAAHAVTITLPVGATTLATLTDVNVTEGVGIDGYVLKWNNATSKWIASAGGGGATTLATLTDVNVTEGVGIDGYILKWNNATSKWIASAAGAGAALAVNNNSVLVDSAATTLNFVNATSITTAAHVVTITLPTGGGGAASARYWRMRGVQYSVNHSGWGAVLAAFKNGAGTVLSTGGTAFASETLSGASWAPASAFDGSSVSGHGWFSGEGSTVGQSVFIENAWLAYDFGTAVAVASVALTCLTGFSWTLPRQIAVDYSNDGIVWKQVNIIVAAAGVDNTAQTFTLAF